MKYVITSCLIIFTLFVSRAQATSRMDLNFNIGPSLDQSGNIQDLGDPDINTGFEFNYFFREKHGLGFSFSNEFDFNGSRKFPGIENASISTFDIHYAYRHIFSPKFHVLFEPGFGWQTIYDDTGDYYWYYSYYDDLSTAIVLDYKIMARYILKEWEQEGESVGSFYLGAGIQQIFSLEDELNGRDISGSRLSMLFQIGVGF